MKFSLRFLATTVLCCVLGGCGKTARKLSSDDLNALQKRTFWSDKKTVFSSTVSVLQDSGYIVKTMDYAGGLITAESAAGQHAKIAHGKDVGQVFVSAFVEEFPSEGTAVRLNFVARLAKKSAKEAVIFDRKLYEDVFEKIDRGVRSRQQIQLYQLHQNQK